MFPPRRPPIALRLGKGDAGPTAPSGWENAAIGDLLDKRLAFITGKGGVGKTTVAYALGLASAARGQRTIVCEIASQHRGPEIFGRSATGGETRLAKGLWTISIDPETAVREYLQMQLPVRAMANILHRSRIFNYLTAATPGLREVVTMGKVWELAQKPRRDPGARRTYDTVIVDAPASGHAIALLQTPHSFREIARVGPVANQAGKIEATIGDPDQTGVGIVAVGEEMSVNESLELESALTAPAEGTSLAVDRILFNGLYPDRFAPAEVRRLIKLRTQASGPAARAALEAATAEAARAAAQRRQLARVIADGRAPVGELPFLFAPRFGVTQLEQLSEAVA